MKLNKKMLILTLLSLNFMAFQSKAEKLQLFNSEAICSKMNSYVIGYRVSYLGAKECRELISNHTFDLHALNACRYMRLYTQVDDQIDYGVSDNDINNCFKTIANREYQPSHIIRCQKLADTNPGFQPNPMEFINCLKY